ncbi:hypothetical protein [Vibrio scophthalmi]|uniref:hypothetical protein n=1 Tax=Vibrio scophthalmi TaxID=45658 RepID=UPI00080B352A|nr:hypothetical protein [Vibrio scophthalmi]
MSHVDSRIVNAQNTLASFEVELQQKSSAYNTKMVIQSMMRLASAYDAVGDTLAENETYQAVISRFSESDDESVVEQVLTAYLYQGVNYSQRLVESSEQGLAFFVQAEMAVAAIKHESAAETWQKIRLHHACLLGDLGNFDAAKLIYDAVISDIEQSDTQLDKTLAVDARLQRASLLFTLGEWHSAANEFDQLQTIYGTTSVVGNSTIARHLSRGKLFAIANQQILALGLDWSAMSGALQGSVAKELANVAYRHLHALFLLAHQRRMAPIADVYLAALTQNSEALVEGKESWQEIIILLVAHYSALTDLPALQGVWSYYQQGAKALKLDAQAQRSLLMEFAQGFIAMGHHESAIDLYQTMIVQNENCFDEQGHEYMAKVLYNFGVLLGDIELHDKALLSYQRVLTRYDYENANEQLNSYVRLARKNSFFAAQSAHKAPFLALKNGLQQQENNSKQETLEAWLGVVQQAYQWGLYHEAIDLALEACSHFGIKGVDSDYYDMEEYDLDDPGQWLDEWQEELDEKGVVRPCDRATALEQQPLPLRAALIRIKLLIAKSVQQWNDPRVTASSCDEICYSALKSMLEVYHPKQSLTLYQCYLEGVRFGLRYAKEEAYCTKAYLEAISGIYQDLRDDGQWPAFLAGEFGSLLLLWADLNRRLDDEDREEIYWVIIEQYRQYRQPELEALAIDALVELARLDEDEEQAMQMLQQCWQGYLSQEPSMVVSKALANLCVVQIELAQELDSEVQIKRWGNNYIGYFANTDSYGYENLEYVQEVLEDLN